MTSTKSITKGALRLLVDLGYAPLTELPLSNGRRVDIAGLNKQGNVTIVEVKSSVADFRSDKKWTGYLDFCEAFYFAVDASFPLDVFQEAKSMPDVTGIIIADAYGAEIVRPASERQLNAARRKALTLKIARAGAHRLAANKLQRPWRAGSSLQRP